MGIWIVVDELVGTGSHAIESFVHLHPAFAVEEARGGWTLLSGARRLRLRVLGRAQPSWEIGWYCPEWGSVLRNPVLRLSARESLPTTVGYVLTPEDCSAEVGIEMEATGIVLKGSIDGRFLNVRSERCTSSL